MPAIPRHVPRGALLLQDEQGLTPRAIVPESHKPSFSLIWPGELWPNDKPLSGG